MVHDYAGHPFQVALSRRLAERGHEVMHAYFAGDPGPKGALQRRPSDAATMEFVGIGIGRPYDKSAYLSRHFSDIAYGKAVARTVVAFRPEVVISGNTPTAAQDQVIRACKAAGSAFVMWIQDFYSVAVSRLVRRKLGPAGAPVAALYRAMERRQLSNSDGIVLITDDFRPLAEAWARADPLIATIENWGALDEIAPGPRDNPFAREFGLVDGFNFVYSGTLGQKHNPQLLVALAEALGDRGRLVVVGQGSGIADLEAARRGRGLSNLVILPLQPIERLKDVLATADVAVSVIEPDAGVFSVPSKVQSYLCAGRAVLLAAPTDNLAAKVVARSGAGLVVDPGDMMGFLGAAEALMAGDEERQAMATRARAYAELTYDIDGVADRFEQMLGQASGRRARLA